MNGIFLFNGNTGPIFPLISNQFRSRNAKINTLAEFVRRWVSYFKFLGEPSSHNVSEKKKITCFKFLISKPPCLYIQRFQRKFRTNLRFASENIRQLNLKVYVGGKQKTVKKKKRKKKGKFIRHIKKNNFFPCFYFFFHERQIKHIAAIFLTPRPRFTDKRHLFFQL